MLKRIDLEQDGQKWLDWRQNGIGASEVLTVLGKSKYKTRWSLFAEKLGFKKPDDLSRNPNVRRGKYFEPLVRDLTLLKLQQSGLANSIEVFCGEDSVKHWRKVSFDGVTDDHKPVEIKCPSGGLTLEDWELLSKKEQEEAINDRYIDFLENGVNSALYQEYIYQLQYQIGMLDADSGYLVFYFEHVNDMKIINVPRDDEMIKEAFEAVDDFWLNNINLGIAPEKDPHRDVYTPTEDEYLAWDKETIALFEVIKQEKALNAQLKTLKAERAELTDSIYSKVDTFKMLQLHALKLTLKRGRQTVNYKQFLIDKGIEMTEEEMEEYTTVGKSTVLISPFKDAMIADVQNGIIDVQQKQSLALFESMMSDSEVDYSDDDEVFFQLT